jgi:hypothetical protein
MADRDTHDWLEGQLYALGREMTYPPTPPLAERVRARLLQQRPRAPGASWRAPRRLAIAALALLLVGLGVALASVPTTRKALAEFFGLQRIRVIQVTEIPLPTAALSPEPTTAQSTPLPTPTTTLRPGISGATTLEDARRRVNFPVLLPTYPDGIGAPDELYAQRLGASPSDAQVILVYRAKPGLGLQPSREEDNLFALYQFRTQGMFRKSADTGTRLEELRVGDARAFWLEGAYHFIQYRDASGREVVEMERVVRGNTLAWEVGDVTYRLETSLPKEEAVRIAESLLQRR